MTSQAERRREAVRHAKSEASSPKSRLMDLLRDLEAAGATADAKRLERVIGLLEGWQARP